MSTMVWDETGARYYETGVSKGILWTPALLADDGVGVPWNGLVAVNLEPQGGDIEQYYFDGVKYMNRLLAEDFQASIQAIDTPSAFRPCEGDREFATGVMTSFGKRDKFHMAWRTEIGSDQGEAIGYKWHIAYNNLVQPANRSYQTISDTTAMDTREFTITATPACGRSSYFWFDSRDWDLTDLEEQLYAGTLPKCYELAALIAPIGEDLPPTDPDLGCPTYSLDLENYIHGQVVSDTSELLYAVQGLINDGLDIIELPAVGAFAANDSAASEVGTGDILADDDDATYITSADGDLGYTVGLPPLVGYVDGCGFELHIRMSISGDVDPDDPDNLDADAQVHISTDATGDDTIGGFSDGEDEGMGFALTPVDGTPQDYVVPLNMDAWVDSTLEDVVVALKAGAYLNVVGATNNNPDTTPVVIVYEASVVMLNDTDSGKWLRQPNTGPGPYLDVYWPIDEAYTEDAVYSHTNYVDFKILENVYDAGAFTELDLLSYNGITTPQPGKFILTFDDDDPVCEWLDTDLTTVLDTQILEANVWYRVEVEWRYTSIQGRLYKRDNPDTLLIDELQTSTLRYPKPTFHANGARMSGDTVSYEAVLDNMFTQIHCNDVDPGPPPGDYELVIFPTSMTSEGSSDARHSPFTVGTASTALIDGLDTSYGWATWLRTVKGVYPLWTSVAPPVETGLSAGDIDPAWVTSIATRFRAKATEADANFYPFLYANTSKLLTSGASGPQAPLTFTAAGTWQDFEYVFSDGEYDTGGWAPLGEQSALTIGSYLYTRTVPVDSTDPTILGDYNIQVSEQCLVIYFTIP